MDEQLQLEAEGLGKLVNFTVMNSVKLASESCTGILWVQTSCKAVAPQTTEGSTLLSELSQSGRQDSEGSISSPCTAQGAG